ncbi:MAG: hypothetical protein H7A47_10690 [Verrucomicrobiales bacterium]|nr:hypothetical protein [Verrucomicrobiales bacterium]
MNLSPYRLPRAQTLAHDHQKGANYEPATFFAQRPGRGKVVGLSPS